MHACECGWGMEGGRECRGEEGGKKRMVTVQVDQHQGTAVRNHKGGNLPSLEIREDFLEEGLGKAGKGQEK